MGLIFPSYLAPDLVNSNHFSDFTLGSIQKMRRVNIFLNLRVGILNYHLLLYTNKIAINLWGRHLIAMQRVLNFLEVILSKPAEK